MYPYVVTGVAIVSNMNLGILEDGNRDIAEAISERKFDNKKINKQLKLRSYQM
jgi:hypothetical protein